MNGLKRFAALSTLALLLGSTGVLSAQYAQQPGPPPGADRDGGWNSPPSEFSDAARRGFQEGMEGARKDYENHRTPNVNNRDEYRHPNVPRNLRRDYRMGFQRGYDAGVRHMMGGGDRDHDRR